MCPDLDGYDLQTDNRSTLTVARAAPLIASSVERERARRARTISRGGSVAPASKPRVKPTPEHVKARQDLERARRRAR
jgi:hypothetical protein